MKAKELAFKARERHKNLIDAIVAALIYNGVFINEQMMEPCYLFTHEELKAFIIAIKEELKEKEVLV